MSQNQTYHKEANRKIQLIDKAKRIPDYDQIDVKDVHRAITGDFKSASYRI